VGAPRCAATSGERSAVGAPLHAGGELLPHHQSPSQTFSRRRGTVGPGSGYGAARRVAHQRFAQHRPVARAQAHIIGAVTASRTSPTQPFRKRVTRAKMRRGSHRAKTIFLRHCHTSCVRVGARVNDGRAWRRINLCPQRVRDGGGGWEGTGGGWGGEINLIRRTSTGTLLITTCWTLRAVPAEALIFIAKAVDAHELISGRGPNVLRQRHQQQAPEPAPPLHAQSPLRLGGFGCAWRRSSGT